MKIKTLLTAILMVCTTVIFSQIIHVPGDQPTIQAGIDVTSNGDTVLVAQGTYFENINYNGKAITVASHYLLNPDSVYINNTIIDGSQPANPDYGSVVTFITGEDTTSVLKGFTITGGTGMYVSNNDGARIGGGIVCYYASAKIIHNIIEGNEVDYSNHAWGAGIASIKESGDYWTVVTDNIIRDNQSIAGTGTATGGGMEIWGNARIRSNRIENNHCISESEICFGGGIASASVNNPLDTLLLENNIIKYNSVVSNNSWCAGGGLDVESAYSVITNNIFEYNNCNGFSYSHGGGIKINYGETTIISNQIRDNQIIGNDGAYGGGISIWYASANLYENVINHNTVTSDDLWGGGVHLFHPETLNFEENTISDNKVFTENVWAGAGVACIYSEDISTFRNNKFTGNAGPIYSTYPQLVNYGSGGGLLITGANQNEVIVDGNIFRADTAKYGGGLSIKHSFNVKVTNNLFIENNAYYGGGMDIVNIDRNGKEDIHPQFTNNTFFNNSTEDNGYAGAMYLWCEFNLPPVTFNNIFYENQSTHGNDIYLNNNTDTVLIAYSNIDPDNIAGNSPWKELENINENPVFIDDSCHLDWPSLCVNAGIESLEINGIWYNSPPTDIDGEDRPFDWTLPDIGADEAQWYYVGIEEFDIQSLKSEVRNYPNPFSTSTTIEYTLQHSEKVIITIYNHLGKQIDVIEKYQPQGLQKLVWSPVNLPNGVYYIRLQAGGQVASGKMILMR